MTSVLSINVLNGGVCLFWTLYWIREILTVRPERQVIARFKAQGQAALDFERLQYQTTYVFAYNYFLWLERHHWRAFLRRLRLRSTPERCARRMAAFLAKYATRRNILQAAKHDSAYWKHELAHLELAAEHSRIPQIYADVSGA